MSAGQLSNPVRSAFALLPAETIEQYEAPAEENEPGTEQELQPESEEAPVLEYFPAGQGLQDRKLESKLSPGKQEKQDDDCGAL